jgi:hypothetical protein
MLELSAWIGLPLAGAGVIAWLGGGLWASRATASAPADDLNARARARQLPALVMAIGIVGVAGGVVVATPWLALHHAVPSRFSLIYGMAMLFCVRMLWPGNRYLRRSTSININRSPTEVSAFLADGRNAVTWQGPQLRSVSILSGEPGTEGATYRAWIVLDSGQTFQGDTRLDEYLPGQMLRWRDLKTGGEITSTETTTLQQQGSGTHLIRSVSSQYEWREAIIQTWEDLLGSERRRRGKLMVALGNGFLAKLKSVLEGGQP